MRVLSLNPAVEQPTALLRSCTDVSSLGVRRQHPPQALQDPANQVSCFHLTHFLGCHPCSPHSTRTDVLACPELTRHLHPESLHSLSPLLVMLSLLLVMLSPSIPACPSLPAGFCSRVTFSLSLSWPSYLKWHHPTVPNLPYTASSYFEPKKAGV